MPRRSKKPAVQRTSLRRLQGLQLNGDSPMKHTLLMLYLNVLSDLQAAAPQVFVASILQIKPTQLDLVKSILGY